ncbi:PAS domain S-box protein [Polaribacter sp. IC063]|nr:PAS domain S-box protein [Polaribacter sp. IC063]
MLEKQNEELKIANKEYYDISLFSKQSLDPNIRINFERDLLQNNPIATALNSIKYKSKTHTIELFLKHIAAKIDKNKKQWNFEASANKIEYSSVCIALHKYIYIYGREITKQSAYQQELEKISLIVQETINAVIIADASGKVKWVHKGFERITGYTLKEVNGKAPGSFLQGKETNLETVAYMRQLIKNSKPFVCEVFNYKKPGQGYWLRIKAQPIFDNNGTIINFFAIEEDITKMKAIQQIEESENIYSLNQ